MIGPHRPPTGSGRDIVLALCPTWTADKPLLALAYLIGALRADGWDVLGLDFNASFYQEITTTLPEHKELWGSGGWKLGVPECLFPILDPERCEPRDQAAADLGELLRGAAASWADRILLERPRAVGFSVMGNTALASLLCARELKARCPELRIVFGGPGCHEGTNEDVYLHSGWVDAVVLGEGEATLVELMPQLVGSGELLSIPGVKTLRGGEIQQGGARPAIQPVDSIASPDYGDFVASDYVFALRELAVLLSRGCVAKCSFCADFPYWGRWRARDGVLVADELLVLHERFGSTAFFFADLMLNGALKQVERMADRLIEAGAKLSWCGNGRALPMIPPPLLRKMGEAGCQSIFYGLEHGSDRVLRAMNKGMQVRHYEEALRRAKQAGVHVSSGFILGHPAEGEREFQQLLDFLSRNFELLHQLNASPLSLISGAAMYAQADAYDLVLPGSYPLPEELAWGRDYRYPFCTGWRSRDGRNDEAYRERLVARFDEHVAGLGLPKRRHGLGREGLYEAR